MSNPISPSTDLVKMSIARPTELSTVAVDVAALKDLEDLLLSEVEVVAMTGDKVVDESAEAGIAMLSINTL